MGHPNGGVHSVLRDAGMPFYIYVLPNLDGKIYIGQTNDLQRRLAQYNTPDCRTTRRTKRHIHIAKGRGIPIQHCLKVFSAHEYVCTP